MTQGQIAIFGSNIASIAFSDIVSKKTKVTFSQAAALGSGWAGISHGDYLLDLGQRFFELGFENPKVKSIADFDATKSQRDFIHLIDSYIRSKGHPLQEVRVETFFRNTIVKCPMETADLSGIMSLLTCDEKKKIKDELDNRNVHSNLEMSKVGYDSLQSFQYNLHEMITHNHGSTFNKLVLEPFSKKFAVDLRDVPIKLRRKLWLPVFYPSTIIDHCIGKNSFNPYRPHYRIIDKSTSSLINDLIQDITIFNNSNTTFKRFVSTEGLTHLLRQYPEQQVFVGTSLETIAKSIGLKFSLKKKEIRVLWFEIQTDDILRHIDYLSVIDGDFPFFRVSSSTSSSKKDATVLCIETFNLDVIAHDAFLALKKMQLVKGSAKVRLLKDLSAPVIDEPSFENDTNFGNAATRIQESYPSIDFRLCNLNFANTTLNAQILTAMRVAKDLGIETY